MTWANSEIDERPAEFVDISPGAALDKHMETALSLFT